MRSLCSRILATVSVGLVARGAQALPDPVPGPEAPRGVLTLHAVLELALRQNPALEAAGQGVTATAARARQAGAVPNPELEVEIEDVEASSDGLQEATTTLRLEQPLELGGKRARRKRMAEDELALSNIEAEERRQEVVVEVRRAYSGVLLAQGRVGVTAELLELALDLQRAAAERAKAGTATLVDQTQAKVEVAHARIAHERAAHELGVARTRLAACWGAEQAVFEEAGGRLDVFSPLPPLDGLAARLAEQPAGRRWRLDAALAEHALALAEAEAVPDVTVSAGLSRSGEDDAYTFVAAVAVPLPLFDRRTGEIDAARALARRAAHEGRVSRLQAGAALAETYARVRAAQVEATAMQAEVLPAATEAVEVAQLGYQEGKYGYLEVLEAQRLFAEASARLLDVLGDYHEAAAELEQMTGMEIGNLEEKL